MANALKVAVVKTAEELTWAIKSWKDMDVEIRGHFDLGELDIGWEQASHRSIRVHICHFTSSICPVRSASALHDATVPLEEVISLGCCLKTSLYSSRS